MEATSIVTLKCARGVTYALRDAGSAWPLRRCSLVAAMHRLPKEMLCAGADRSAGAAAAATGKRRWALAPASVLTPRPKGAVTLESWLSSSHLHSGIAKLMVSPSILTYNHSSGGHVFGAPFQGQGKGWR